MSGLDITLLTLIVVNLIYLGANIANKFSLGAGMNMIAIGTCVTALVI